MKRKVSQQSRAWAGNPDSDEVATLNGNHRSRILYFNRQIHVDIRKLGPRRWSWRLYDDFEGSYGRGYKPSKKGARDAARDAKNSVKFPPKTK
jgi:hypothetical protein